MSRILDQAAKADPQRAADLAANDAAMKIEPRVMRCFGVSIKAGTSVRAQFECMAHSSMEATIQHADLVAAGEYILVRALEAA